MARKRINIRDLKHRIALCSQDDIVTEGGAMVLVRKDVHQCWARIEPRTSSMFSVEGFNILENRNKQTHLITMRMRRDFDIASSAWVYEERLQSGARWFKVLGIKDESEDGQYMTLSARLIERGDDLVAPVKEEPSEVMRRVDSGVRL